MHDLDALGRREWLSYAVLSAGVAALAWFLARDFGLASFARGEATPAFLAFGTLPYALAAVTTRLSRRSWEATSWLFGTWLFMTVAGALFLLQFTVFHARSGFLSELVYLGPPLGQVPVVGFAAAVAFVLHRRDPDRS